MGLTLEYLMTPIYVGKLPDITLKDDPERPLPEKSSADYDLDKLAVRQAYGEKLFLRRAISPMTRSFAKSYVESVGTAIRTHDGRISAPEYYQRSLIESVLDHDRRMETQRALCAIPSDGLREMVQKYTQLRIMTIYQRYADYLGEHSNKLEQVAQDLEECKQSCSLFAQYWRTFAEVLIQDGEQLVDQSGQNPASAWAVLYCSLITALDKEVILQTILHHTLFSHPTPTTNNALTFEDIPFPAKFNEWRSLFQEGLDGLIKRGYGRQAAVTIHQDIKDLTSLAQGPDPSDLLSLKELVEDLRDLYSQCEDHDIDDPDAWTISESFKRLRRALRDGQDDGETPLPLVREELKRVLHPFM